MMGVYIKGMEMPTRCYTCPCADLEFLDCNLMPGTRIEQDKRLDDCPLVPVPPHGRLIDADEADSRFTPDFTELSAFQRGWNAAMERVCEDAPTIIPEDRKD